MARVVEKHEPIKLERASPIRLKIPGDFRRGREGFVRSRGSVSTSRSDPGSKSASTAEATGDAGAFPFWPLQSEPLGAVSTAGGAGGSSTNLIDDPG